MTSVGRIYSWAPSPHTSTLHLPDIVLLTNVPRSFPFFFTVTPCIILCKIKNKDWDRHGRKLCLKCEVYYPCLFSRPLLPHLLLKRRVPRWVVLLRNNPGTLSSDVHICALGLFVFQFMLNWFFSNQVTSHDIVLCNWNFLPKMWWNTHSSLVTRWPSASYHIY